LTSYFSFTDSMFILLAVNETPEALYSSMQAADLRELTHYITARELTTDQWSSKSAIQFYNLPSTNQSI